MKMLREWDELPDFMRTEEVRPYYVILKKKNKSLIAKRAFDLLAAVIGLTILGRNVSRSMAENSGFISSVQW